MQWRRVDHAARHFVGEGDIGQIAHCDQKRACGKHVLQEPTAADVLDGGVHAFTPAACLMAARMR
jgi:hypothetical protein